MANSSNPARSISKARAARTRAANPIWAAVFSLLTRIEAPGDEPVDPVRNPGDDEQGECGRPSLLHDHHDDERNDDQPPDGDQIRNGHPVPYPLGPM
jgi:hypothetical protein